MVRHIVLFKVKEEFKDEIPVMIKKFMAMKEDIPELIGFEIAQDFVQSPRSCDVALMATVKDRADLDVYGSHPSHVPLKKRMAEISEQVISGDYEF